MYILNKIKERKRQFAKHPVTKKHFYRAATSYVLFHIASRFKKQITYKWINGLKIHVRRGDAGIVGNIFLGLYEFCESGFLLHFLREDDLFLDIGANLGHYSLLASGIKKCKTIAVEPVPVTYHQLYRQIELNSLSRKITAFNIGVGDIETTLLFSTDRGTMNRIVEKEYHSSVEISVQTIDQLCKDQVPSLLKIDVEGFEKFALEGSIATLKNTNLKAVIIEINFSNSNFGVKNNEIVEIMTINGFSPYKYEPHFRKLTLLKDYNKEQFNTIFIRDEEFVKKRILQSDPFLIWGDKF
jgi:FkbM family methyltransferase